MTITPVRIAKDVLKWLALPKAQCPIRPKTENGYVVINGKGDEIDVQKHVKSGKKCEVCGIGGLAVALAARIDSLKTENSYGDGPAVERADCVRLLRPYFSSGQLDQIEEAFEDADGLPEKYYNASATKRLKVICENIVENKGKFVPV